MNNNLKVLSDLVVFSKYAKFLENKNRRETFLEICERNKQMHLKKYKKFKLNNEIEAIYNDFVVPKKVLPSMRSMQFAGKPIDISPNRIYNCGFNLRARTS